MSIKSLSKKKRAKNKKAPFIEDVIEPSCIRTVSFAKAYPEAATLWDHKRNCGFGPEDFSYASSVRAWFKCPRGKDHKFRAYIISMSRAARNETYSMGCGFCRGLKASVTNNLAQRFPHLAKEWMVTKNGFKPDQISSGSNKKVWWKCKCGNTWKTAIAHRTTSESGCPKCNLGSSIDLRDYPEVLLDFDRVKNKGIDPHALPTAGAYFWRCSMVKSHTWVSGFYRTSKQARCPYCTNKKASKENNLKKSHPALAKQWHKSKNKDLKPTDVTSGSSTRAWWQCSQGPDHEWQTKIADRTSYKTGCPFCSLRRTSITNVISTVAPHLVKEWHKTKNGKVKPKNERISSRIKRWWLCSICSHEWQAEPQRRIVRGSGCPRCAAPNSTKYLQKKRKA